MNIDIPFTFRINLAPQKKTKEINKQTNRMKNVFFLEISSRHEFCMRLGFEKVLA